MSKLANGDDATLSEPVVLQSGSADLHLLR
jgi:hypothetical protein